MHKFRRSPVLAAAGLLTALMLSACAGGSAGGSSSNGENQQADLMMNWFAQAEQGGYWQAEAEGLGAEHGVEINVRQGGPQIQTIPQVASGEADFGVAQADELVLARAEGVPVVQVFGGMDTYLQCMMHHPGQGIQDWGDLNGHRIAVAPSGGFWEYIKGKYDLDVQEVNFTGQMANFADDPSMVQQCFSTSEPYVADQQGIDFEIMMVAETGYNPYSQGLFTTERVIEENPELVQGVVAAAQQGWQNFLADPSAGTDLILETNEEMEEGKINFGHEELSNGDYFADPIGAMTEERWQLMADQLREAGVLSEDVDVNEVWTDEFMP